MTRFAHPLTAETPGLERAVAYAERLGQTRTTLHMLISTIEIWALQSLTTSERVRVEKELIKAKALIADLDAEVDGQIADHFRAAIKPLSQEARETPIVQSLLKTRGH